MKAVETSVVGLMDERAQRLQHKLHDELERVLQQLYNIQQVSACRGDWNDWIRTPGTHPSHDALSRQASDKTRRVVEERVKQSTSEQLTVQRELQKVGVVMGKCMCARVCHRGLLDEQTLLCASTTQRQERRDKEELLAQVKRLSDRVVLSEAKQVRPVDAVDACCAVADYPSLLRRL